MYLFFLLYPYSLLPLPSKLSQIPSELLWKPFLQHFLSKYSHQKLTTLSCIFSVFCFSSLPLTTYHIRNFNSNLPPLNCFGNYLKHFSFPCKFYIFAKKITPFGVLDTVCPLHCVACATIVHLNLWSFMLVAKAAPSCSDNFIRFVICDSFSV